MEKLNLTIWSGRTDHLDNRTSFRYHQIVEVSQLEDLSPSSDTIAIIGFASEEGVRRNNGRLGTVQAPDALRGELAKLPWKSTINKRLVDIGTIECLENDLEESQQQLGDLVAKTLKKKNDTHHSRRRS